jgi:ERCC4-type nuclease
MIYLDNREVPSELPTILDGMNEQYELVQLNISDIQVHGIPVKLVGGYGQVIFFIFERKDCRDFIASVISGHLNDQLYRMSTAFKHSVVILEGSLEFAMEFSNVNRNTVFSALAGTFLKHSEDGEKGSVSLLMVDNLWDLALIIKYTNSKLMEPLERVAPMELPEVEDKKAQVRSLLAVSGLGEARARAVLAKMGNLRGIANAKPEDLICEGVGLTSAKKIVDFFSKKLTD